MGRRAHVVVAAVPLAAALVLTGCATPTMPPALTDDQVAAIIDEQNAQWWSATFPDEEMPTYDVIRSVPQDEPNPYIDDCLSEANLPVPSADDVSFFATASPEELAQFQRVLFRCAQQYPVEYTDPTAAGLLSEQQLGWVYDYYESRLIPCLRLAGYTVSGQPAREVFVGAPWGTWSPYLSMSNPPTSSVGWAQLDQRCPPPAIGPLYRPGAPDGEP